MLKAIPFIVVNSFEESRWIRSAAYKKYTIPQNETILKRILYISRCCGPKRWTVNEDEVMNALGTLDVPSVMMKFDNISFVTQVRIMANTTVLISIHGAQLTNALFMRPGSSVMEIFNPLLKAPFYYNLCRKAELNYLAYYGTTIAEEVPIEIRRSWWCLTAHYNTIVNITLFLPAVKSILSE